MINLFIINENFYLPAQVDHEEWYSQYKHFTDRERAMIHDWMRDRRELLNRAKVTFAEACQAAERQEEKERSRAEQRELCEQLYNRVRLCTHVSV